MSFATTSTTRTWPRRAATATVLLGLLAAALPAAGQPPPEPDTAPPEPSDTAPPEPPSTAPAASDKAPPGLPSTAPARPDKAPPGPPAAVSPAPPAAVSPDDIGEIQRALGADQAAARARTPPAAPAPASAPPPPLSSMNPSISFIADLALAGWTSKQMQTGGHDPTHEGFNLQALEMAVSADVDPYFKFNMNVVFGHEGVEVEEAYATTSALPGGLQLRGGEFLTRFGRINATHPHTWDFVDQPLVIGKMMGEDGNRGLGVEASWLTPLPWYTEIVLSQTMATGACCARSFYGEKDLGVHGPRDLESMVALKQFHAISPDWSLAYGVSAAYGPNATARGARSTLLGADVYLKYRPITRQSSTSFALQAEGIARRRETPKGDLHDAGMYAQVVWRFDQRWGVGARYELVTGVKKDYLDPEWESERQRLSANITFYPTEFSRLRLQGSADVPAWQDKPIYAGFLALEVAVGPHGAHPF
ncbi:MAG: hypothetical protein QM820_38780 [Minicystis sp.]